MTRNLSIKTIIEKTKRGYSLEEISEHFGISPDVFESELSKKFGQQKATELISSIQKKKKKPSKRTSKKEESVNVDYNSNSVESETSSTAVEVEVYNSDEEEKAEETKVDFKSSIQDLENQVGILTNQILEIEKKRKSHLSNKNALLKELSEFEAEVKTIQNSIIKKRERILSIFEEIGSLTSKAQDLYKEGKAKTSELEALTKKIAELKKVTILVLSNGQLQYESGEVIEISDDSSSKLYNALVRDERLEELTVKEIKQLSKLFYLADSLRLQQIEFNILFDSEKLETVFKEIAVL